MPVDYQLVSPGYFQLLEIDLIRGRGFTEAERAADAGVRWFPKAPRGGSGRTVTRVGQIVRIQVDHPATSAAQCAAPRPAPSPSSALHGTWMAEPMFQVFSFSGVYLPVDPQSPGTSLMLRVRGDPEQARLALLDRLTQVDPALDHEVQTMRTVAGMGAYILQIAFWVTLATRRARAGADGVGPLQRPVLSRRATRQGNRRADGPWRDDDDHRGTGVVAMVRPVGFGLLAGGGLAAALAIVLMAITRFGDRQHRPRLRSPGVRCEPDGHRHRLRAGRRRFPPCAPRASIRSRRSETTEAGHRAAASSGREDSRSWVEC